MNTVEPLRIKPNLPDLTESTSKKCQVKGILTFSSEEINPTIFTKLRIYDNKKNKLCTLYPNKDGYFSFTFDASEPGIIFNKIKKFKVEVVQIQAPYGTKCGLFSFWDRKQLIDTFKLLVPPNQDSERKINLSLHKGRFESNSIAPSIDELPNQEYICEFLKSFFPHFKDKTIVNFEKQILGLLGTKLTGAQVQELLNTNDRFPKIDLTPENLIKILMNSVGGAPYTIDGENVIWECNWDRFRKDIKDSLANVRVVAKLDPERQKLPTFEMMIIEFNPGEYEKYVPNSEGLERALYIANSAFLMEAEGRCHLGVAHLVPGLLSNDFFKYIPKDHPLYSIMAPHFEKIKFINYLGSKNIIFGDKSILALGPLTSDDLNDLIVEGMKKGIKWDTFKARVPLANQENHYLAHAEEECFEGLKIVFKKILEEKWPEISNPKHWRHLWHLSSMLSYHFNLFQPFIKGKTSPEEGDCEKLINFLSYCVTLIFIHFMAHSSQAALTNIFSASLGIRNKAFTQNNEFARDGNTDSETTLKQLIISRFITEFKAKTMLDPNNDVHPEIRNFFQKLVSEGSLKYYTKGKELHKDVEI